MEQQKTKVGTINFDEMPKKTNLPKYTEEICRDEKREITAYILMKPIAFVNHP